MQSIVRSKETKYFPTLIFSIEQFEKNLILLGKKAKVSASGSFVLIFTQKCFYHFQENLMESFKRSMARDFRIDLSAVESVLNEGEEDEEEEMKILATEDHNVEDNGAEIVTVEDSDDESPPNHSKPPPPKRIKRS